MNHRASACSSDRSSEWTAKRLAPAMAGFLAGRTMSAYHIEFVNLIVEHLTEHGVVEAARLYEAPFTDLTPRSPDGIFASTEVDLLLQILDSMPQLLREWDLDLVPGLVLHL